MDRRRRVGALIDGLGFPRWMYATRNIRVGRGHSTMAATAASHGATW